MTQHTSELIQWALSTCVLEGDSFSQVAKKYNVSKAGAAKIFHKTKFKIFPLLIEREELGINMNDIESLRKSWGLVKGF